MRAHGLPRVCKERKACLCAAMTRACALVCLLIKSGRRQVGGGQRCGWDVRVHALVCRAVAGPVRTVTSSASLLTSICGSSTMQYRASKGQGASANCAMVHGAGPKHPFMYKGQQIGQRSSTTKMYHDGLRFSALARRSCTCCHTNSPAPAETGGESIHSSERAMPERAKLCVQARSWE